MQRKALNLLLMKYLMNKDGRVLGDTMATSCGAGSIPYIRITDLNKRDGTLTLEHVFDGRELELLYAKETIKYLFDLWGHKVVLHTKTKEGRSVEIVCDNDRRVTVN